MDDGPKIAPQMPYDEATERFGARLRAERVYVRIVTVSHQIGTDKTGPARVIEMRAMRYEPGIEPTGRSGRVDITIHEVSVFQRWIDLGSAVLIQADRVTWE